MSLKSIESGAQVVYSNSGSAITAGSIVVLPDQVGIALEDIAATNGKGPVALTGVYEVTKEASQAWVQGDKIYYNATDSYNNTPELGDSFVGFAHIAAASGAALTTGRVRLAKFSEEIGREVTAAATGAQALVKADCTSGNVVVYIPNTAALTFTLPPKDDAPDATRITLHKNSADAEIITPAGNGSETLIGTVGTIDADNDRVTFVKADTAFALESSTIA